MLHNFSERKDPSMMIWSTHPTWPHVLGCCTRICVSCHSVHSVFYVAFSITSIYLFWLLPRASELSGSFVYWDLKNKIVFRKNIKVIWIHVRVQTTFFSQDSKVYKKKGYRHLRGSFRFSDVMYNTKIIAGDVTGTSWLKSSEILFLMRRLL